MKAPFARPWYGLARGIALSLSLLASSAAAQLPNVVVSAHGLPTGFSSQGTTTCGALTIASLRNVLASEPLFITVTSTPTQVVPTPLTLRRALLAAGVKDCSSSIMVGSSPIPIDPLASPAPFVIFDSFANPGGPFFGPPILGPSTIQHTLQTGFLLPVSAYPLSLVFIALTEDLPGGSTQLVVSDPFEVELVDPAAAGFAPTLTSVAARAGGCPTGTPSPSGPENMETAIMLTGTRFPVQTTWYQYPPVVMVGNAQATGVVVHSPTTATAVAPALPTATCPPVTAAGPRNVTIQNDPAISPSGVAAVSPIKFTYCSGRIPILASVGPMTADPEGGDPLTIDGFDFLHGASVVMTAAGGGGLATTILPDDPAITGSGPCDSPRSTTISWTTPPFCTGSVSVQVINPDGVASEVEPLVYGAIDPQVTSLAPMVTITGLSGPATFPAMTETGTTLTIGGSQFITPSSPLFGAPTVPQGASVLFPTRTEIYETAGGPLIFSGTGTVGAGSISVLATSPNQLGEFRTHLGLKTLRVLNPPCVSSTPGQPAPSTPQTILVQDSLPPLLTGFFPNVATPPAVGTTSMIRIDGSNFFTRLPPQALPVKKEFAPGVVPSLADVDVPAVAFGSVFSPHVELVNQNQLLAQVPAGLPVLSSVPIKVFNPDGRSATSTGMLEIVPRLTTPLLSSPKLDADALLEITDLGTNPFAAGLKILFVPNPTPVDDQLEDIANGGDPSVTGNLLAYDAIFLFNTRDDAPAGEMRLFDFSSIDVPATITLPAPVAFGPQVISAGVKRVIFKSTSFLVTLSQGVLSANFHLDESYPLVLRSHGDFTFSGMLDLSGDALVNHAAASSPTLKFQYRCEWQLPPSGGGLGGRGGLHYENALIDLGIPSDPLLVLPPLAALLPPAGLGTTATTLTADSGFPPREREPVVPEPMTWGRYGLGRAPFGGQAGGGAGGGHASAGGAGQGGQTTSAAPMSATWGNFTNLPATTPGRPPHDPYIYGSTTLAADFDGPLGTPAPLFPRGLFAGGSGGGGGGGSLALVVPCVSVGGRGGNGGGSAVLLSDRVFKLGPFGRIYADGERGMLGIDAFPFPNGEPLFVLCAPGGGGGGSGGTIFIAAVADVDLTAPPTALNQRFLSANGGPGGAPPGSTTVATADGGAGGSGRIRVAMNELSSMGATRQAEFQSRVVNGNVAPSPGPTTLGQADFFRYPSPP